MSPRIHPEKCGAIALAVSLVHRHIADYRTTKTSVIQYNSQNVQTHAMAAPVQKIAGTIVKTRAILVWSVISPSILFMTPTLPLRTPAIHRLRHPFSELSHERSNALAS